MYLNLTELEYYLGTLQVRASSSLSLMTPLRCAVFWTATVINDKIGKHYHQSLHHNFHIGFKIQLAINKTFSCKT